MQLHILIGYDSTIDLQVIGDGLRGSHQHVHHNGGGLFGGQRALFTVTGGQGKNVHE